MSTFGSRLRQFRKSLNGGKMSQKEFADSIGEGIKQSNISQWESDFAVPYGKNLLAIKQRYPELNFEWLETGIGVMKTKLVKRYPNSEEDEDVNDKRTQKVSESEVQYLKTIIEQNNTIIELQSQLLKEKEKRETKKVH